MPQNYLQGGLNPKAGHDLSLSVYKPGRDHDKRVLPPLRQPRGKFKINLPQMLHDSGSFCMAFDSRNHRFALGCLHGGYLPRFHDQLRVQEKEVQRLVSYCRTTSASTAPCTSRRTCCPCAYVLVAVPRVSRSCELVVDGFDLHLIRLSWYKTGRD